MLVSRGASVAPTILIIEKRIVTEAGFQGTASLELVIIIIHGSEPVRCYQNKVTQQTRNLSKNLGGVFLFSFLFFCYFFIGLITIQKRREPCDRNSKASCELSNLPGSRMLKIKEESNIKMDLSGYYINKNI